MLSIKDIQQMSIPLIQNMANLPLLSAGLPRVETEARHTHAPIAFSKQGVRSVLTYLAPLRKVLAEGMTQAAGIRLHTRTPVF
jgi:hypothetical protein